MSVAFRIQGLHYYHSNPSITSVGRCTPPKQEASVDIWNEIDRRNEELLYPRNPSKSAKHFSISYHPLANSSTNSFYFNSYHSYRQRRRSSSQHSLDDQTFLNPSIYLNNYFNKQSAFNSGNNDSTFLYGNSIIKSNKADILYLFDQRLLAGEKNSTYTDQNGVIIDENGPFWPESYRILYPTPKLLTREVTPKEFYLSPSNSNTNAQQTYDNQPAIYKYTISLKHPAIIFDMDRSPRIQPIKANENEQICPQLIFEARFEGGNLQQVKRVGQFEYELILRPDLYTRRHTQWYYFRVQNMIANITYRFRIINLMKKSSLYNDGMQTLLFSEVDAKRESRGWHRVGHHINYSEYRQRSYNTLLERDINYFELDFQFEFPHSGDTCYIAHCYPYTYSDLKDDLDHLSTTRPRDIFRRDILCESQAGNSCFMITVTDESVPVNKKKFVFITARIHPGETNSSYMMRGLLEYITSNDKIAQKLRSQLVFKIIPMLNPDGVIVGNYRCSLTGRDMNRNFRHPRRQTFPIIYHMKELMQNLQREQREILAFCDLHGHSRKSNVFAYGCDGCDGPQPDMKNYLNARVLPFIMSKTAPDMFSFDCCKFHIQRCKESTGRVVMWKEMLIKNSFTLEASFAGSSIVERSCHFSIQDYEKFGQCICQSLRQYLDILSDSSRLDSIYMNITKNFLQRLDKSKIPLGILPLFESGQLNETHISINSLSSCLEILTQCQQSIIEQDGSSSSDSDSDPEGGEIPDPSHPKDKCPQKKKLKKKRSDKSAEERSKKSHRKRQVNRSKSVKSTKTTKIESQKPSQIHIPYPYASAIDINSQLKFTVAADQMDKPNRLVPERGTLFTSKYAKRNGNGFPIFTTERASERRNQKRITSAVRDTSSDRDTTDDCETDIEPSHILLKSSRMQHENSILIEENDPAKRTASLISLSTKGLPHPPSDQTPRLKGLRHRHLQRVHPRQKPENEPWNNPPPIITMSTLMEVQKRLAHSASTIENETHFDYTPPLRSLPKREAPIVHPKLPSENGNPKRTVALKPLNSIESAIKERSIRLAQENSTQSIPVPRANQDLKKQLNVLFDKK